MLLLAPMENLGDRTFRRTLAATTGGFDEACTEFMRMPNHSMNPAGSARGVTAWYDAYELAEYDSPDDYEAAAARGSGATGQQQPGGQQEGRGAPAARGVPLGAQLMGSDPQLMALAARYLVEVKRAPRVDLNCGCPANTVTGNGAGSSLLRTPELLRDIVAAMVEAVGGRVPVSVKLRAGYGDTSRFEENLLAAQEGGAAFVTLHPRTKAQSYRGRADWGLTARAVQLLRIPVVGNGDVVSVQRAHELLRDTGCHGVMVGRGAVQDPLLFHRIRFSFQHPAYGTAAAAGGDRGAGVWGWREPEVMQAFIRTYASHFAELPTHGSGADPQPGSSSGAAQQQQQQAPAVPAGAAAAGAGERSRGMRQPERYSNPHMHAAQQLGRLKVLIKYLFTSSPALAVACESLLRVTPAECSTAELVERLCAEVGRHWPAEGGPTRLVLVDHMNKETQELRGTAGWGLGCSAGSGDEVGCGGSDAVGEEGVGAGGQDKGRVEQSGTREVVGARAAR